MESRSRKKCYFCFRLASGPCLLLASQGADSRAQIQDLQNHSIWQSKHKRGVAGGRMEQESAAAPAGTAGFCKPGWGLAQRSREVMGRDRSRFV